MELSKKVAYLKGLMEGLKIDDSTNEGKILTIMADILDEMSATVEDIAEEVDETVELVDTLDEDLGEIEDLIYGDDDDDDCCCNDDCCCDDDDDDDDDAMYECVCPNCGDTIMARTLSLTVLLTVQTVERALSLISQKLRTRTTRIDLIKSVQQNLIMCFRGGEIPHRR